tara:strand:- start:307 stop:834 length:528 start_codon:yes stop_codon:yes gene_type:complete
MEIKDILKMNPESECKITYNYQADYTKCYFQLDEGKNLNPNDLPKLDEKYVLDGGGEHLTNDKYELVFDSNEEILYKPNLYVDYTMIYNSKTFIKIIQKKIKELMDSDYIYIDDEEYMLWEAIEVYKQKGFIIDLCSQLKCDDVIKIEESEENPYLWFTYSGMDFGEGELLLEEI